MAVKKRKRKIKLTRVLLLVIACLIPLALVLGFVYWFTNDPYEKYHTYEEATKQAGSLKHDTDEKEDAYYVSLYYPKFDIKVLDDAVAKYRETQVSTDLSHEGMFYVTVDYDSDKLFDRFTCVTFHQKIRDVDDQVLFSKDTSYTYDAKQDKLLNIQDVLRREYLDLLQTKASAANMQLDGLTTAQCQNFILDKNAVSVYFHEDVKQKVTLPYAEFSNYIALQDSQIPSLYQQSPLQSKEQPSIDRNKKMVAFTFDDGPHYQNTQIIMDEFEKYNGRATFFMLGQCVENNPEIVKEVYQRGFEVGNHSWDHSMALGSRKQPLSKAETIAEIYHTQDAIYQLIGHDPVYFRPPYGAVNDQMLAVNQLAYGFWDVDSRDWETKNAELIKNAVVQYTEAGNVVILLHDIHNFSRDSIKSILPILDAKGYQFVTYATLMQEEEAYLVQIANHYGVPTKDALGK